ncbi:hypothetical protein I7I48_07846 [Histoplasma ohiense]|nr:hypothetical protein I7I48_07846 [Histoplasma ohiense (nom. inval.)]
MRVEWQCSPRRESRASSTGSGREEVIGLRYGCNGLSRLVWRISRICWRDPMAAVRAVCWFGSTPGRCKRSCYVGRRKYTSNRDR